MTGKQGIKREWSGQTIGATGLRSRALHALCILALVCASSVSAQQDFSKATVKTIPLGNGMAMLEGAGGNIAVSTGADGVLIVDDQYAPMSAKIQAAIEKLSTEPVRYVLNTHWHGDHTGGNEHFGSAGGVIIAHEAVRERMSTDQFLALRNQTVPASPEAAWPDLTYSDGIMLHANGQTIRVQHVDPAHTDGDSIIHFKESDVIHTGDTFVSGMYPFVDVGSGGRLSGIIAAADVTLGMAGPRTRIIPGHGPLSSAEDVKKWQTMLKEVRERVRKLVAEGKTRDQVVAAQPTWSFDAEFGGGFLKPEEFAGIVFDSVTASSALGGQ